MTTHVEQPSPPATVDVEAQRRDALGERIFGAGIAAGELATIFLGGKLGLYAALRQAGPSTASELAGHAKTHERSTREWLEQQAVAGILDVDDVEASPDARRYRLPAGHAEVLLERDSLAYLGGLAQIIAGIFVHLPDLVDALHADGAVPYASFGADAREGQASLNRPAFVNQLASEWLPQMPDIHARLHADPPARVADVGCGGGWASIALARTYPKVRVKGLDSDPASIELARANAHEAGVADRVSFEVCDVSAAAERLDPDGRFELVLALETIHDMGRPVAANEVRARIVALPCNCGTRLARSDRRPSGRYPRLSTGQQSLWRQTQACVRTRSTSGEREHNGVDRAQSARCSRPRNGPDPCR